MKSVPEIQQFRSRKEWEEYVWKIITASLANVTSSKDVEKYLAILITAYEKKQIINRFAAASFLKQGRTYREIGELLWLSHPTISAIKKSMRAGERYASYYERSKTNKKEHKQKLPSVPLPTPRRLDPKKYILPHGKLVFPQRRRR